MEKLQLSDEALLLIRRQSLVQTHLCHRALSLCSDPLRPPDLTGPDLTRDGEEAVENWRDGCPAQCPAFTGTVRSNTQTQCCLDCLQCVFRARTDVDRMNTVFC
ncbi:uncharacterized protein LOC143475305 isoform X2 [Brachyhypopomus gauderio]|uniref:uncharacterized protein LOC143475305 isoform X2 n=1 Tax=Brachyhypopomus gauderio TaxID=698409 RepID=UPI00404118B4